jgi:hypothetical protein
MQVLLSVKTGRLLIWLLVAALLLVAPRVASAQTLSILLSRGYAAPASKCQSMPGGVSVWQVSLDLAKRGGTAAELIEPGATLQSAERCDRLGEHLSWDELHTLQAGGWEVYPRGSTSDTDDMDNSCGLLPTFTAEGFPGANLLYAPAGGKPYGDLFTAAESCYLKVRDYGPQPNVRPGAVRLHVMSLNGGTAAHYWTPATVLARMADNPAVVIQGYRFFTGAGSIGHFSWDCKRGDTHWTSKSEMYCYNDFLAIIHDSGDPLVPVSQLIVPTAGSSRAVGRR